MTRGTVPAAETGHCNETRISRWLNPGRLRTTDRVGGAVPACLPKCLPACGAALRLLPRWLTVPLCTVRIEHPAARLRPGVPSRPSSACWLVYRSCRNECVIHVHIYARNGILTHALSTLLTIAVQPFPTFW